MKARYVNLYTNEEVKEESDSDSEAEPGAVLVYLWVGFSCGRVYHNGEAAVKE